MKTAKDWHWMKEDEADRYGFDFGPFRVYRMHGAVGQKLPWGLCVALPYQKSLMLYASFGGENTRIYLEEYEKTKVTSYEGTTVASMTKLAQIKKGKLEIGDD